MFKRIKEVKNNMRIMKGIFAIADDKTLVWSTLSAKVFSRVLINVNDWHDNQYIINTRSKQLLYVTHVMNTAIRLHSWGVKNGDLITLALLHDTLQKSSDKITGNLITGNLEHIDEAQEKIAEITTPQTAKQLRKITWNEKKESYDSFLKNVLQDPEFYLLMTADFIDNIQLLSDIKKYDIDNFKTAHVKYATVLPLFEKYLEVHKGYIDEIVASHIGNDLEKARDISHTLVTPLT